MNVVERMASKKNCIVNVKLVEQLCDIWGRGAVVFFENRECSGVNGREDVSFASMVKSDCLK